jgi:hypothetical protein
LRNLQTDVNNFMNNASRVLNIDRRSQDAQYIRQIGFRSPNADGSLQTVVFNCSTQPCLDIYDFQIDRIDTDLGNQVPMIRARFSFEARIVPGRSYAFFFEGCCRPPLYNRASPDALSVLNNPNLPFHVRAEVLLVAGSAGAANPTSSISFAMPDQARIGPSAAARRTAPRPPRSHPVLRVVLALCLKSLRVCSLHISATSRIRLHISAITPKRHIVFSQPLRC